MQAHWRGEVRECVLGVEGDAGKAFNTQKQIKTNDTIL
jgi:hypothetical protein